MPALGGGLRWPLALLAVCLLCRSGFAQRLYREDFEGTEPTWRAEATSTPCRLLHHERSRADAHSGRQAERLELIAGSGQAIYFTHAAGQARLLEELNLSLWVKASQSGVQLSAKVVLPNTLDPASGQPVALLLHGDSSTRDDRWEKLRLEPMATLRREMHALRARLRRDVNLRDAYVDRVALNVYTGSGHVEVFVDDLELGPYVGLPAAAPVTSTAAQQESPSVNVEIRHDEIVVDGQPLLLRAVRHRGEPLEILKAAGFNTVWLESSEERLLNEARATGLGAMATVPPAWDEPRSPAANAGAKAALGPEWDPVWFWYLGTGLGADRLEHAASTIDRLRAADSRHRLITADVAGGLDSYSSELDLMGVHRWPLMGEMGLKDYREWLLHSARLAKPGSLLWTWIQTDRPAWMAVERRKPTVESLGQGSLDAGPSPIDFSAAMLESEQIWLLAHVALSAGYRGLGFWTEQPLAGPGSSSDRERLLTLALLNLELRLLEPWLARATYVGTLAANPPEVEAAVFRTDKGLLLLPVWYQPGAQFVPGQEAANTVTLVVPGVPEASHVWEVGLTQLGPLQRQRVSGGVRVTLEEFGLTSAVLFCSDPAAIRQLRVAIAQQAAQVADLRYQLAATKLERVAAIDAQLRALGHGRGNADALLRTAQGWLNGGAAALARQDYEAVERASQRAMRALRLLQRAQWEEAVASLTHPGESPYALCYNTLPEHWRFRARLQRAKLGPNLLPTGNFEEYFQVTGQGWRHSRQGSDDLEVKAELSPQTPHGGRYSLRLAVSAESKEREPAVVSPTPVEVSSPPITVEAGQLLRISGWARVPQPIRASDDGAVLSDSSPAPSFALRWKETRGWQPFVVYRPVAAGGTFRVTLSLSGLGEVYFDDLAVHAVSDIAPLASVPAAESSGNPKP